MAAHGTRRRYQIGCRCDPCKESSAAYHRTRYVQCALCGGRKSPKSPRCWVCYNVARVGQPKVERKPMEIARIEIKCAQQANERVLEAIRSGAHSRYEIKKVVHLDWDDVSNSLAYLLFEQNVLVSRVEEDDRRFYLRAA